MLDYEFEASIAYWVCRTAHAFERALNEQLTPLGITQRQWQVLGWLAHEGELAQTELADRMRIEAATLVGILDRMERDGWITREPSPVDRRKKLIRPTPRVEPVWSQIVAGARRVRAQATRGINPKELQRVRRVLAAIQDNLGVERRIKEVV